MFFVSYLERHWLPWARQSVAVYFYLTLSFTYPLTHLFVNPAEFSLKTWEDEHKWFIPCFLSIITFYTSVSPTLGKQFSTLFQKFIVQIEKRLCIKSQWQIRWESTLDKSMSLVNWRLHIPSLFSWGGSIFVICIMSASFPILISYLLFIITKWLFFSFTSFIEVWNFAVNFLFFIIMINYT